ncbi:uncharacterized protein FFC1_05946 [Fusarium fujikuroi]
MPWMP